MPSGRLEGDHLLIATLGQAGEGSDWPDEIRERLPMLAVLLVTEAIEPGAAAGTRLPNGFAVLRTPVPGRRATRCGAAPPAAAEQRYRVGQWVAHAATVARTPAGRDEPGGRAHA
jgi:hypothetical protein